MRSAPPPVSREPMNVIESGKVVSLALTVIDTGTGAVLQRFTAAEPSAYLHGHSDLVAALEAELEGKEMGHTFSLEVPDAYGAAGAAEPTGVPRREFPKNWDLRPGVGFFARGSEGATAKLYVHEVRGSRVYVSAAHPWAGRTVRFEGQVLHVRNATEHERAHGHAHGAGGHHH